MKRKRYNPYRVMVVRLDEFTYLKLHHACKLLRCHPGDLVQRGIKIVFNRLEKDWPQDWFSLRPSVVATISQRLAVVTVS